MEKRTFTPEKISTYCKVSADYISDMKIVMGSNDLDFVDGMLTAKLDAYVMSMMEEERVLTYYCERPTFLDWLLRREKKVEFNLEIRSLMLNPPKEGTKRIYLTNLK